MIAQYTCTKENRDALLSRLSSRREEEQPQVTSAVEAIIKEVRKNGDVAVREFTEKFDGACPPAFLVSEAQIEEAFSKTDPCLIAALEAAAQNIRAFHERQCQRSWMMTGEKQVMMGQQIRALHRVGVYVPGGTAAYPSTVLMNVIPAKVAGVSQIVMTSPPTHNGTDRKSTRLNSSH